MDNNERLKELIEEIGKINKIIDEMGYMDSNLAYCINQIGDILNIIVSNIEFNIDFKNYEVVDEEVVDKESLKNRFNDLEDELEDALYEWEKKSTMINRNPTINPNTWSKAERIKSVGGKAEINRKLKVIKDFLKDDRVRLLKLLHNDLYKNIEDLRKICVDTGIYRDRFNQNNNSWFTDNIDGTMDNLERSGRDYVELVDNLIAYTDSLITKINNGDIDNGEIK